MKEKIEKLQKEISEQIKEVKDLTSLNIVKANYLGKKGPVSDLTSSLRDLDVEKKKEYGKLITDFRNDLISKIEELRNKYEMEELNKKLESEKIDISMPSTNIKSGSANLDEFIIEDVENFFISMGYDVVEGPEIELDKYNFEMLNLPKDHPARDAQDTFYLDSDKVLLRTQTSPVQIREMLSKGGKEPVRMICPGKTYRRENVDMTHEAEFCQIEGLVIDKNISLSDLKGTFNALVKHLFGEEVEARFRPSYYPFTEPSVEMDMSCPYCDGSGCSACKPKGWITICGGGMVHPNVLKNCGYDPNEWQGFAFGAAAERIAMIKYGLNDIRVIHENDLRNNKNLDRRESDK